MLSVVMMFIGIAFMGLSALGIKRSRKIELDYIITLITGLSMFLIGLVTL